MKYISLLPCIHVTKGYSRSCIIDFERSVYCEVPKTFMDFFLKHNQFYYSDIVSNLNSTETKKFDEYLKFLIQNKFIFESETELHFKYLENISPQIPFKIQSIILDSNSRIKTLEFLKRIDIHPEIIQIRLFYEVEIDELEKIIKLLYVKDILNVEIILKIKKEINLDMIVNFFKKYNIISSIKVYNFNENKNLFNDKLKFVKKTIDSKKNCGIINEDFFCVNINSIALNSCNNSCLFKKISIDKDGSIKNCPSMTQNFGNIKNTTLDEALKHPDFKKYWNVTKDMIDVCKDCEFRHICTDCRAYTERTHFEGEIDLSKPLKCGYNPYTNEWDEWSTNPLKQKAIEYYDMQELVKKDA